MTNKGFCVIIIIENEREVKAMNKDVKRIREIDEQIRALFAEKDKILDKYTREEINKLHDKVWADVKPHYSF